MGMKNMFKLVPASSINTAPSGTLVDHLSPGGGDPLSHPSAASSNIRIQITTDVLAFRDCNEIQLSNLQYAVASANPENPFTWTVIASIDAGDPDLPNNFWLSYDYARAIVSCPLCTPPNSPSPGYAPPGVYDEWYLFDTLPHL
jgi:hypothetical protein